MSGPGRNASMVGLGLLAGVLGGLFGIGGGLIIVPALVILFQLDQKTATGTSLFALVWPVGLLGVLEYHGRGQSRLDWGAMISIGLVGGVLIGSKLTAPLSPRTMKKAYGVFLLAVGLYLIARNPAIIATELAEDRHPAWRLQGIAIGLVAGVLGGLFGIGGGLVIVPLLKLWGGLDPKTAVGTSLFAQVWPVGLLGVREYYKRGEARIDLGAWIGVGLLLGNLGGARLTRPMDPRTLDLLYGAFLILVGTYYEFSKGGTKPVIVPPDALGTETPSGDATAQLSMSESGDQAQRPPDLS